MAYQPRRTERSWTNDDGHFYVHTTSFGNTELPRRPLPDTLLDNVSPSARERRRHSSLIGGIFSMLDQHLNSPSRPVNGRSTPRSMQRERSSPRFPDEPMFGREFAQSSRRSSIHHERGFLGKEPDLNDIFDTEMRPRRERNYRQRSYENDYGHSDPLHHSKDLPRHESPRPMRSDSEPTEISRIENAIRYEEQEVRQCHRTIRSLMRGGVFWQIERVETKLKEHEARLSKLQKDLRKVTTDRSDRDRSYRQTESVFPDFSDNSSAPRRNAARRRSAFDPEDSMHFFAFSSSFGPTRTGSRNMHNPLLAGMLFEEFARLHQTLDSEFFVNDSLFGAHPSRSTRSNRPYSNDTRYERTTRPRQPRSTRPDIPPNVFKAEEAKSLYAMYDKRWNELSHDDSAVPYPARGLDARSLLARDTIWAPDIPTPVVLWSTQDVMSANLQAFFLAVNDLTPTYTLSGAKIVMGYDRRLAAPDQVNRLLDMLKKEKMRWHSDRLGRRNNGQDGINEALQSNEQARAVFHAVCELKDFATTT